MTPKRIHRSTARICLWLALLLICHSLSACGGRTPVPVPADTVLSEMLLSVTAPDGCIRALNAPSDTQKLSLDLLAALYGGAVYSWYEAEGYAPIDDCAVYISEVIHPFELGVFRCKDEGELTSVLGLCAARLDVIKRTWQGSAYEAYVQNAVVTCSGAYVLLVVSDDPETIVKAAKGAMRG